MISLRTNTDSISGQNNLSMNQAAQSKTIQSLTSGYRINSSGDDAAGLARANALRDNITELTQGVGNANDGVAQLQIIDGGLSNISTILDRMKTLATQSASGTFTGDRTTLNKEYSGLVQEITRQSSNINLNSGGSFNKQLSVYIGGANSQANATVNVDLSGSASAVDATSLGLSTSNVLGGGVGFTGNTTNLNTATSLLAGSKSQTLTFQVYSNGSSQTVAAQVNGGVGGITGSQAVDQLNSTLNQYGITASTDSNGALQFSGATAFTVKDAAATGGVAITNESAGANQKASNTSNYNLDGGTYAGGTAENLSFTTSQGAVTVALTGSEGLAGTIAAINAKSASIGLYAVENSAGTGISFQSANQFSIADDNSATPSAFAAAQANYTPTAPASGSATNANAAIAAINSAVQKLGLVQGSVGAGENKLQYAMNLANSQISNYSSAQSQIRDTDVAAAAANLTKGQVLQQASVAAMAQANSEAQSVMKLLQG